MRRHAPGRFMISVLVATIVMASGCGRSGVEDGTGVVKVSIAPRSPNCHVPILGSVQLRSLTENGGVMASHDFLNATDLQFEVPAGTYRLEGGPDGIGCRSALTVRVKARRTTATTIGCY